MTAQITYKVMKSFEFYLNDKILNYVYVPLIGYDAVNLYKFLYQDCEYDQHMGNVKKEINRIASALDWEYSKYVKNKEILEAVGLINTYLDEHKGDNVIFCLMQTPSWEEFKNNHKLNALLKKQVDTLSYDRIRYLFEGNNQLNGYVNISCTFDSYFKDDELIKVLSFDFQLLYDTIFKMYNKMITIAINAKAMIEAYFKNYELSFKEILNVVLQSIYRDDKHLAIDNRLLKINFEKMVNTAKAVDINYNININRNHQIFLQDISDETFEYVIADYKTINSEQYISCISKAPISKINKNLIDILRKQYHLPDFIINVLIDYSIYKNAGRIEPNYLQKIAISINRLNIVNVEQLLQHLRRSNQIGRDE